MSIIPNQIPKGRYVPHKTLKEGTTYIALADSDYILAVRVAITKVTRIDGSDGKPATNADGTPGYYFTSQNITTTLTKEEYKVRKQLEDEPT